MSRKVTVALLLVLLLVGASWLIWRGAAGPESVVSSGPQRGEVVTEAAPSSTEPSPVVAPASRAPTADPALRGEAKSDSRHHVLVLVRDVADERVVPSTRVVAWWRVAFPDGAEPTIGRLDRRDVAAVTDREGRARLEFGERPPAVLEFDVDGPWQAIRWHREGDPTNRIVGDEFGEAARLVVWVRRSFRLQGTIKDSAGMPIAWATVAYGVASDSSDGSGIKIESTEGQADEEGRFGVGPFPEDPTAGFPPPHGEHVEEMTDYVTISKEGFATARIKARAVSADLRDRVSVTLTSGTTLAGTLVDVRGRPLGDVVVAVEYGDVYQLRRGTRTDARGRWRIDRLSPGKATLQARAFAQDAKVKRTLTIAEDDLAVRLVAEEIRLPRAPNVTKVLGLSLCDVDDALRAAYDVPERVRVLILDAGPDPESLGIGRLEKGYGLWMVGETGVSSVRDALERLLQETNGHPPDMKRVVYTFWNEEMSGTNTQHLRMTPDDLAALQSELDRTSR